MSDRFFLDANLLIYAIETSGPDAHKSASAKRLVRHFDAVISVQVLGEFYRAVTSPRRASPLSHDEAVGWVQLWKRFDVRPLTTAHVDLALEIAARFQVGYFDALILAAAQLAGCSVVYSEDLNHGQQYDRVRVENPFAANGAAGR